MSEDLRFCGPYDHPEYAGEDNDGSTITEQTYVPLGEQIQEYIRAGLFLEEYRRARWDFAPDEPVDEEVEPDPTRSADPSDVWILQARLLGKRDQLLAAVRKEEEDKMKEEAREKIDEKKVEKSSILDEKKLDKPKDT
nr:MAG: hypothetical protein [Microviridae sp.]